MTTPTPRPDRSLLPALEELAGRDAHFAKAFADCGLPPVRRAPRGLPGLLRIVAAQQVSAASARALMARLEAALPQPTAAGILALGEAGLRAAGFSRPKIRYLLSLGAALGEKRFSLARLHRLDDEAAIAYLAEQPGFGRWSGEVYLLFSLQRPDVMPAGDLALQVAAQRLKRLRERPDAKKLYALSEAWRPHRSAAARFLWHAYRHPGLPG
jgi:DNA-3-methyladenine glycosylase II